MWSWHFDSSVCHYDCFNKSYKCGHIASQHQYALYTAVTACTARRPVSATLYNVTNSLKSVFYFLLYVFVWSFAESAWSLSPIGCNTYFCSVPFSFSTVLYFCLSFFHYFWICQNTFNFLFVYLFIYPFIRPAIRPSVHPNTYLSLFVCLFFLCGLSMYLSVYWSTSVGRSACPLSFLFSVVLFVPLSPH